MPARDITSFKIQNPKSDQGKTFLAAVIIFVRLLCVVFCAPIYVKQCFSPFIGVDIGVYKAKETISVRTVSFERLLQKQENNGPMRTEQYFNVVT